MLKTLAPLSFLLLAAAASPAPHATTPEAALLAATRASRDAKEFARAEELARTGLNRFPGEPVWPVLLALILADEGKGEEALAVLATPAAQRASPNEVLLAHAYASRRAARPFDALRDYFAVLDRDPGNAEARSEAATVLRGLRAPYAAAALVPSPDLPLAADMAAAQVRWGVDDAPSDPSHRFDQTDRAIRTLDDLIARAKADDSADTLRRLRLDRIVAYRDRKRMADVVAEADTLQKDGGELPSYAREAYADALLYLRRPEEARAQYELVLAADNANRDDKLNRDARIGAIYSSVEMEDFASAFALADALLKDTAIWRRFHDDPSRYPNDDYVDSSLLAAAVRSYGDESGKAWELIKPLRDGAPGNAFVRLGAASIMSAKGWPRRTEEENRIALALSPSLAAAQIAVAESALARNRFAEAKARIADLVALYPENTQVRRLADELAAETGWQIEAEFRPSNEKGGGSFGNSGNELNASLTATSPVIDDAWRVLAGYTYSDAHPPEGFAYLERANLGGQLVLPDLRASAAVTQSFGTLSRTGLAGTLDWSPTDAMTFALAAERISSETPLRALLHDITADSVSARFTYTWDDAHNVQIGASWMPFTDGNDRESVDARYTDKVVSIPHFSLTLAGELYGSVGATNDTPYYSPTADGSAALNILAEHTIWRRYETSWVQALTLNGGWYGENSFKGGPIGTATYEQRWRVDPWGELVYGAFISERMYDGAGARVIGAFITLRRSF